MNPDEINPDTGQFQLPPANMDEQTFVEKFGGVYEHTPWIARAAWHRGMTEQHNTARGLSEAMMNIVAAADRDQLLALINAHPDLAGKAAINGELTAESTSEQAGAGIDQCTPEEFARFQDFNQRYKAKFGFPFIMAVKGSNRHKILAAFEHRLKNNSDTEFQQAITEINKIARLRLEALASGE